VVKCADWVVDLGPGGGEHGGALVASGPPEVVAQTARSTTAPFLAEALVRPAPAGVASAATPSGEATA